MGQWRMVLVLGVVVPGEQFQKGKLVDMTTIRSLLFALACLASLEAQVSATLKHVPNGPDELWIQNNSRVSLVAFAVTVNDSSSRFPLVICSDSLIDLSAEPLRAGGQLKVAERVEFSGKHLLQEPIVVAGILADGTTTGNAVLLAGLSLRRSNMLLAVETTLETLSEAGRHNVPREQLIGQFKKMVDSLDRWYLPAEQQVGLLVYRPMIGRLMNLPDGKLGAAFPPDDFVAAEAATLRQRRMALLESEPAMIGAFHNVR